MYKIWEFRIGLEVFNRKQRFKLTHNSQTMENLKGEKVKYIFGSLELGLEFSIGNNICVLPVLETSDLVMKFKDGSVFKDKTLDGQGNLLANQLITFNVNGVFYNRTTGSDGIAELNINLMKGEYIITSMWNDFQTGNKISIS